MTSEAKEGAGNRPLHVCVMMPSRDGTINESTTDSLIRTFSRFRDRARLSLIKALGSSILHEARSRLIGQALAAGADRLVFLDDDVSFEPEDFERLVWSDRTLITAAVPMKRLNPSTMFNPLANLAYRKAAPTVFDGDMTIVDKAGFGLMCADRSVFKDMWHLCPRMKTEGVPEEDRKFYRMWTPWGEEVLGEEDGEPLIGVVGEDVHFIRRAASVGHLCWWDRRIMVNHHYGAIKFSWNEAT